jgi:hypothetical protein
MKTAAPGYTRRRPPNGHSHSQRHDSTKMALRATPSPTGSGPWPLVTRKEPLPEIVWLTGAEIQMDIGDWANGGHAG